MRETWPNRPDFVAIATNATIAKAVREVGANDLLAVKANQPTLRAEVEACFAAAAPGAIDTHVERGKGHGRIEQRTTSLMREVSSAELDAAKARQAVRGHWAIEKSLHWILDVGFGEDQPRLRKGFGAKNMAVVRHFALNLVRAAKDKKSIKLQRKLAGWTLTYLNEQLLSLDSEPCVVAVPVMGRPCGTKPGFPGPFPQQKISATS